MKKLIDLADPFFAPVWIRVCVVLVTAIWGLYEMSAGATLWGVIFLGISAICAWRFATIDYTADPEE
ncbi:MAG: hypothetical protein ACI82I_003058 [Gammaproteobacteria bacterium]